MKKTIFLILFLLSITSSYADNTWTSWRANIPVISSIACEDSIIWCGTNNGVIKYNKITGTYNVFTTMDGLYNDDVTGVAVDHDGVKWFTTRWGISKYDNIKWESYPKFLYFYDIAVNKNNSVWLATPDGIIKFSAGTWQTVKPGNYICLTIDSYGIVWAGSNLSDSNKNHIARIEGTDSVEIKDPSYNISNYPILDITVDHQTSLIMALVFNGFVSYDDNEKKLTGYLINKPDSKCYSTIAVDKNSTVWLGNTLGLTRFQNGIETLYTVKDGLIDNRIHALACDDDGVVWIGTELGLASFDGNTFTTHIMSPLPENNISTIVIDNDDRVWISTPSAWFNSLPGTAVFYHGEWRYGPRGIGDFITVDSENVVWSIKEGYFFSIDGNTIQAHYMNLTSPGSEFSSSGSILDLYIDNKTIWITSYESGVGKVGGIYTYDGNKFVMEKYSSSAYTVTMDSNHTVWAGTWDGLYKYDGTTWTLYTVDNGLPQKMIKDIEIDNNGIIWCLSSNIGGGGNSYNMIPSNLIRFDGTTFTAFTKENSGLPNNNLITLKIDKSNSIWIGTDAGVSRFDGETWTTFNTQNSGLCDNKVNAIAVEKNNTIWFGTDNGISRYTGEVISTSVDENTTIPQGLPVIRSFPNPFNPSTTIEFTLPETGQTNLSVYNIAGQRVRVLVAEHLTAGRHTILWDGKDDSGSVVSAGIYFARLTCSGRAVTGKMVMVK